MMILQLLSIVFGIACAVHDVPAVDSFNFYGSTPKAQNKFHLGNLFLKLCYVGAIALTHTWLLALCCGFCIWLVFDPVLNVLRTPRKSFFYLSTGNRTDRTLLKILGPRAGVYKFIFCVIILIAVNYFYGTKIR